MGGYLCMCVLCVRVWLGVYVHVPVYMSAGMYQRWVTVHVRGPVYMCLQTCVQLCSVTVHCV